MLVSSRVKDGKPWFQVHKQGLSILRSLKNKRLRIIVNITYTNNNLQNFNSNFIQLANSSSEQQVPIDNYTSILQISPIKKQLSNNRVIVFLNAYHRMGHKKNNNNEGKKQGKEQQHQHEQQSSQPQKQQQQQQQESESSGVDVHLLVLGYLVASVFFYHEDDGIREDSLFTKVMGGLGSMLQDTDILKLQQQIKYTKGSTKKPYFLYLLTNPQLPPNPTPNYHDTFRQIYKYTPNHEVLNKAVDTLIDYFPERSATYIGDYGHINTLTSMSDECKDRIRKVGNSYLESIMGRHMFNFEITGASLQSLCFQACDIFNTGNKSINLLKMFTKIIQNQKSQLTTLTTHNYTKLLQDFHQQLPMQNINLMTSYYKIQKYTLQESIDYASNCMTFYEFVDIYAVIRDLLARGFQDSIDKNKELWRNFVNQCYEGLQETQQQGQGEMAEDGVEGVVNRINKFRQDICLLIDNIVTDYTNKDLLTRYISKTLESLTETLQTLNNSQKLQSKHQKQRAASLQVENKAYQYKLKQLEGEYLYLDGINKQFKAKLLESNSFAIANNNSVNKNGQVEGPIEEIVAGFKKKVLELELELSEKNSAISYLTEILDKLEVEYSKKYTKQKFSKECQSLLSQITQKSHSLFSLFTELKKTQCFYKQISQKLQKKKQQYNKQREKDKKQLEEHKQKIKQFNKQRVFMQEIITESKKSIGILQDVKEEYKATISELQNNCSRGKCLLAEMEGEFQKWKKALELVVAYTLNGKVQKLKDFYKVTTEQMLKDTLKPIFKK